jgi:hypothetical protein
MEFQSLTIVAEGQLTAEDARVHIGGVPLSTLLDGLPSGKYIQPAKVAFGKAKITVELLPETLEEVAA